MASAVVINLQSATANAFVNQAGKEVKTSIQRTPEANNLQEIVVVPDKLEPNALFLEAMIASTKLIERGNHKLGYIHVWSYAGAQYQHGHAGKWWHEEW